MIEASLIHWLHRASQVAENLFSSGRTAGSDEITPRQLIVLATVASKEGASQTDVVDATGIDRSTLADLVRRLHKRGLLVRRRRRDDARAYALKLSEEGRKAFEEAADLANRVESGIAGAMGAKDHSALVRLLKKFVNQALQGAQAGTQ